MPDENLAPAPVEPAAPAIEPTDDNQPHTEPAVQPAEGEGAAEPIEELEEFDWEGKTIKAPKGLKDGVLRQADYTRKTQEVSAKAKELAAREERIAEQSKATEDELNLRAQARYVDHQIGAYDKWTPQQWQALKEQDPQGWTDHRFHLQALKEARGEVRGKISEAETKRTQETERAVANRLEQTQEHARKIKGWTPDMDKEVVEYAVSKGVSADELARVISPGMYDMIRFAKVGEALAKNPPSPGSPQPTAAPLEVVGAKSSPSGRVDLATADMETYVRARKAQEEAKRR